MYHIFIILIIISNQIISLSYGPYGPSTIDVADPRQLPSSLTELDEQEGTFYVILNSEFQTFSFCDRRSMVVQYSMVHGPSSIVQKSQKSLNFKTHRLIDCYIGIGYIGYRRV